MRPEHPEPGSPQDWLRYARSDLAVARQSPAADVLWETLCFHAQQAAEKSIKAVLVHRRTPFPYTHDLSDLVIRIEQSGLAWPPICSMSGY